MELKNEKERDYKLLEKYEIKGIKNKEYDSSSMSEMPSYMHPRKKDSSKQAKGNGKGKNMDKRHEEKIIGKSYKTSDEKEYWSEERDDHSNEKRRNIYTTRESGDKNASSKE